MRHNASSLMVMFAMLIVGVCAQSASAQGSSQGLVLGDDQGRGWTVRWSVRLEFNRGSYIVCPDPRSFELVEGPELELEPLEEEAPADEGAGQTEAPLPIDVARALLRSDAELILDDLAVVGSGQDRKRLVQTRALELEGAEGAYRAHLLKYQEDAFAMRELALVYVLQKRYESAADLMVRAYQLDPELGIFPLPSGVLGDGKRRLRDAVSAMVRWTHMHEAADGWFVVSVLMQAQGRLELADEMLGRGEARGLDPEVAASLRRGLAAAP